MSKQTFVHDGVEVVKTGKSAKRELRSGKYDVLVEITPRDQTYGSWKKWVDPAQLFLVEVPEE